jgi:hypothetical protein
MVVPVVTIIYHLIFMLPNSGHALIRYGSAEVIHILMLIAPRRGYVRATFNN